MSRRGRPRKPGKAHVFRLTLTLREGEDDDLLPFFLGLQPGQYARAIKQALRAGGVVGQVVDDEDDDDLDFDGLLA